ncbi:hypothetical protein ACQ5SK_43555 [Bradyrhizobium japonicum]
MIVMPISRHDHFYRRGSIDTYPFKILKRSRLLTPRFNAKVDNNPLAASNVNKAAFPVSGSEERPLSDLQRAPSSPVDALELTLTLDDQLALTKILPAGQQAHYNP